MRVQVFFDEPSLTVQGFKDQCDLRVLMRRFSRVADLQEYIKMRNLGRSARFGDFSEIPEYWEVFDRVRQADASFMALPEELRSRFRNDPVEFMEFVLNPANKEEVRKLGLTKQTVEKPVEASKAPPPAG